jgi:hypothetical protein
VQNGTPLYALRETGGRSGVEMVRRYAHLAADHLAVCYGKTSTSRPQLYDQS